MQLVDLLMRARSAARHRARQVVTVLRAMPTTSACFVTLNS